MCSRCRKMKRTEELAAFLDGRKISSGNTEYHCISADEQAIVFGLSEKTRKVMIPTELALEWVQALKTGLVDSSETARQMREKIVPRSSWAPFQHGFETHLKAIAVSWTLAGSSDSECK